MLIDEVELLHVELWHAGRLRAADEDEEPEAVAVAEPVAGGEGHERPTLRSVLRERLRRSAESASAPHATD
jgi:hypothetical protein